MQGEEEYLGGFYSPLQLALGAFAVGAGIYATSQRLLIVGKVVSGVSLNHIVPGSDFGEFVPANLTREQNMAIISEILRHRGVQIEKRLITN